MADMWIDLGSGVSHAASEASYTLRHFPRRLDMIRIMRIPFYGTSGAMMEAEPGHYWLEIDHGDPKIQESYGWYPATDITNSGTTDKIKSGVSMFSSFFEVEGCINGDSPARRKSQEKNKQGPRIAGGGIGTEPFPWDPHHGAPDVRTIRHPYVGVGDDRSEDEIVTAIRDYTAGYKQTSNGRWTFKFDDPAENNCHTFVWQTLYHCGLIDVDILDSSVDPHFASISMGGQHTSAIGKVVGYIQRPEFVDYLSSKAKVIQGVLSKYGQAR
ncbi:MULTISPECIES: hypothetical protein [Burkholderia]|uniref:hypothetical protein n=1 Tax=Burkholderia TaxID=32008 RepID=UPI00158F2ACD|nr:MULTISPECIES: hypothetical protein [Burkholderia]